MLSSIFSTPSATTSTSPKVIFSQAELSSKYLDASQPPTKETPFRQIRNIPYIKDVKICMPASVRESLYPHETRGGGSQADSALPLRLRYARVVMTLKDILEDENLRRGNYIFLSASPSPSSNSTTISLDCGKLVIDMPFHIYQRAGLTFPASKIPSGGRKHDSRSARHRIETDLRQPSMVKGKKGFDRLMYASKNVEGLSQSRTWMFYDLFDTRDTKSPSDKKRKRGEEDSTIALADTSTSDPVVNRKTESGGEHPLSKLNPNIVTTGGTVTTSPEVMLPSFISSSKFFSTLPLQAGAQQASKGTVPTILEEDIYEVIEYLSLIFLQSSRITKADYGKIDPFLCQYTLPDVSLPSYITGAHEDTSNTTRDGTDTVSITDLITTSYSGFIPSVFMTQLLVDIIRRSRSTKTSLPATNAWVAVNVVAHPIDVTSSPDGLTILLQAENLVQSPVTGVATEDTTTTDERQELQNADESGSKTVFYRGLKFVTCFEFVDSSTR